MPEEAEFSPENLQKIKEVVTAEARRLADYQIMQAEKECQLRLAERESDDLSSWVGRSLGVQRLRVLFDAAAILSAGKDERKQADALEAAGWSRTSEGGSIGWRMGGSGVHTTFDAFEQLTRACTLRVSTSGLWMENLLPPTVWAVVGEGGKLSSCHYTKSQADENCDEGQHVADFQIDIQDEDRIAEIRSCLTGAPLIP